MTTAVRTRTFTLNRRARSALRTAHVVLAVGWTGLALIMLALPVALLIGDGGAHAPFVLDVMGVVGNGVIPFFAVGTVLTGVVAGLGTPWGVFRHRWVVAKTVLALAVIASSVTASTRLLESAQVEGGPATWWWLAAISVTHQVALVVSTVLSVEKPRLRRRHGR